MSESGHNYTFAGFPGKYWDIKLEKTDLAQQEFDAKKPKKEEEDDDE